MGPHASTNRQVLIYGSTILLAGNRSLDASILPLAEIAQCISRQVSDKRLSLLA